jgi:hypothetical protein
MGSIVFSPVSPPPSFLQAIHYYLADDTIEVREKHAPNSGRDPASLLMSRQRVPLHYAAPGSFARPVMRCHPWFCFTFLTGPFFLHAQPISLHLCWS